MKVLVISDVESKSLWDYFQPSKVDGVDLILSCGDLDPEYLTFLVTMVNCPLLYVHGNHDGKYEKHPPEGCECIEDQIAEVNGVRILGLGGSYSYSGGAHQYTEKEMKWRVLKLWRKLRRSKGFDILLTHAPAMGVNDLKDPAHRGFETFNDLIKKYAPKYFIHGHVHLNYGHRIQRTAKIGETIVINGYEAWQFEYK